MLDHLLESGAPAPRRRGWAVVSGAVHAGLVAAAAVLTMRETANRGVEYVDLVHPMPALEAPRRPVARPSSQSLPATGPIVRPDLVIEIPTITPVGIPEPSTPLSGSAIELVGPGLGSPVLSGPPIENQVYSGRVVDRAVLPDRNNPTPEFPSSLRTAGVEGSVLVQFVVDTLGRVEPVSISIVKATHPQFGEAVRRWLGRTRYSPAEIRGQRVRQLVQQEVGFTLEP